MASLKPNFKMKKSLFYSLLIISSSLWGQGSVTKIDSGSINKADYRIFFPENWKGKLVMFAHGHEFVGSSPQVKQGNFSQRLKPFLERGYAVAASSYQYQGYALPVGVDDTEALRQYFNKKYGKPDTTYMVGQSLGGGVALATIENFSKNYAGSLALCPFASRPYLILRKEFDIMTIANALFPGIVSPISSIMNPNDPYKATDPRQMGPKLQRIREMLAKDSLLAVAFGRKFDIKYKDLPMALGFNENVLRDIAKKAGGNPFDNTNTVYTGLPNDYELNKKIERIAANVEEDSVFGKYDRTGNIGKPVVILHTVYDQLIPPQYAVVNFDNMVHQQNKEKFLTVKFTNGEGHCAFTPQQTGKAFDELRTWVKTGVKSNAGFVE
jgi:pimeloyl-ACP methyl ester carboxylesterase